MTSVQPNTSSKIMLKSKVCDVFERFVNSRINSHNNYDYSIVSRTNEDLQRVGFIDNLDQFYSCSDSNLVVNQIAEDFNSIKEVSRHQIPKSHVSFSQHPVANELFTISSKKDIHFINTALNSHTNIETNYENQKVTWIGNSFQFFAIDPEGNISITDAQEQKNISVNSLKSRVSLILSHPTEPLVVLAGNSMQIIDTRSHLVSYNIQLKASITCMSWMPKNIFGAAAGFADGSVELFSLGEALTLESQEFSKNPIKFIEFCPSRLGTAMIGVENDIEFAKLPVWGFGRLTKTVTHSGHIAKVREGHWSRKNELKVISCDCDRTLNLWKMPQGYLPALPSE